MTIPAGLLDQSAVAKLLASMTGGANLPTPQGINPNAPPPPAMQQAFSQGLAQNPVAGDGPGLMGRQSSPGDDPTHDHRKGLRGSLLHAVGADRVAPELANLLTPDQQARVRPGLLSTAYNAVVRGKGPEAVQRERAATMLQLEDLKKSRDRQAREERLFGQIQEQAASIEDPQARLEYVARMSAGMGLPQGEQTALAAQRLEPTRNQPLAMRTVSNVLRDGKVYTDILDGMGRLIRSEEQFVRPNEPPPQNVVASENPDGTVTYKTLPTRVEPGQPIRPTDTGLRVPTPGRATPQEIKVVNNERQLAYDDAKLSIQNLTNADGSMKDPPSSWDRVMTRSDWTNFMASDEGQSFMNDTRKLIRSWVVLIEGKRMSDADARVNEMMRSFRPGDKAITVDGKKQTLQSMAQSIRSLGQAGGITTPVPGEPSRPAGGRTVTVNGKTFIIPE